MNWSSYISKSTTYSFCSSEEITHVLFLFLALFKGMSFESKPEWDTNINSIGGAKDVCFVSSPYSNQPSANPMQGSLTGGNLITEFEPPKVMVSPADDGYYVRSRIDVADVSDQLESKEGFKRKVLASGTTQGKRSAKLAMKEASRKEGYTEMPGFRGSEIHQEAFTQEETNYIFVILISVVAFCIVGICFGFLVPRVNVRMYEPLY